MLIPFSSARKVAGHRRPLRPVRTSDWLQEWKDGSYVVGILDGAVVGATALSKGLCLIDFTDAAEVVAMLRENMPANVRALVRTELLKVDQGREG